MKLNEEEWGRIAIKEYIRTQFAEKEAKDKEIEKLEAELNDLRVIKNNIG